MRILIIVILISTLVFPINLAKANIFNSQEVRSRSLKPFFKWTGMLERYGEKHRASSNCTPSKLKKCHRQKWEKFLNSIKGKNTKAQIKAVNKEMNEAEYILDIINWGVQDYWATPYQFFIKDGDCEDYAIAKYMSLKALGFSPDDMRIVVLQDTNLGVIHAVLAVYVGNEILVLDNQITQVVSSNRIHHYVPIYSINERFWWRHRKN